MREDARVQYLRAQADVGQLQRFEQQARDPVERFRRQRLVHAHRVEELDERGAFGVRGGGEAAQQRLRRRRAQLDQGVAEFLPHHLGLPAAHEFLRHDPAQADAARLVRLGLDQQRQQQRARGRLADRADLLPDLAEHRLRRRRGQPRQPVAQRLAQRRRLREQMLNVNARQLRHDLGRLGEDGVRLVEQLEHRVVRPFEVRLAERLEEDGERDFPLAGVEPAHEVADAPERGAARAAAAGEERLDRVGHVAIEAERHDGFHRLAADRPGRIEQRAQVDAAFFMRAGRRVDELAQRRDALVGVAAGQRIELQPRDLLRVEEPARLLAVEHWQAAEARLRRVQRGARLRGQRRRLLRGLHAPALLREQFLLQRQDPPAARRFRQRRALLPTPRRSRARASGSPPASAVPPTPASPDAAAVSRSRSRVPRSRAACR